MMFLQDNMSNNCGPTVVLLVSMVFLQEHMSNDLAAMARNSYDSRPTVVLLASMMFLQGMNFLPQILQDDMSNNSRSPPACSLCGVISLDCLFPCLVGSCEAPL